MTGHERLGPRPLTSSIELQDFSFSFSFSTMEIRALKALPWDVVVDGILPRLLERSERAGGTGLIFPTIKHRRALPTSVELLDRLVALINEWYSDERDEVGSSSQGDSSEEEGSSSSSARITDLYMS